MTQKEELIVKVIWGTVPNSIGRLSKTTINNYILLDSKNLKKSEVLK